MSCPEIPVLVFTRAPRPGNTKRRLIPALGPEGAAELHRRMLHKTVTVALAAQLGPVQVWATPSIDDPALSALHEAFGVALHLQHGVDLGDRMLHAFRQSLLVHAAAIIVGSDCPEMEAADLRQAGAWLRDSYAAVLGPSRDGGYFLIATKLAQGELFRDIPWGEAGVLEATRVRLRSLRWPWAELPERSDVDRPADLVCARDLADF